MNIGMDDLRRLALGVTGLLVLVVLWGAGRVLLLSPPEPLPPAESSLNIAGVFGDDAGSAQPTDLTARPLFWFGRKRYVPPVQVADETAVEERVVEVEIDKATLVGKLGAGRESSIIVTYGGASQRLKLNDELEGWRFVGLTDEGAEFKSAGRTRVLTMDHASPAAPPKAAKKPAARKNTKDAETVAKSDERRAQRTKTTENRRSTSVRRNPRQGGTTSVWGGRPKAPEPEGGDGAKDQ